MRATAPAHGTFSARPADTIVVMSSTWTFQRGDHRLLLQRHDEEDRVGLIITGDEGSRTIAFRDFEALVTFQMNMEQFLVRTGWSLAAFAPDRRRYQDRRWFPRVHPDRRRWWTDTKTSAVPRNGTAPNQR